RGSSAAEPRVSVDGALAPARAHDAALRAAAVQGGRHHAGRAGSLCAGHADERQIEREGERDEAEELVVEELEMLVEIRREGGGARPDLERELVRQTVAERRHGAETRVLAP